MEGDDAEKEKENHPQVYDLATIRHFRYVIPSCLRFLLERDKMLETSRETTQESG